MSASGRWRGGRRGQEQGRAPPGPRRLGTAGKAELGERLSRTPIAELTCGIYFAELRPTLTPSGIGSRRWFRSSSPPSRNLPREGHASSIISGSCGDAWRAAPEQRPRVRFWPCRGRRPEDVAQPRRARQPRRLRPRARPGLRSNASRRLHAAGPLQARRSCTTCRDFSTISAQRHPRRPDGALSFQQRFGGSLNSHCHVHSAWPTTADRVGRVSAADASSLPGAQLPTGLAVDGRF